MMPAGSVPTGTIVIGTLCSISLIGFLVYTAMSYPNEYKESLKEKVLIRSNFTEIPSKTGAILKNEEPTKHFFH